MEPVPEIWAIRFPAKRQTIRISMRMEACLWRIAARIPAAVSSLSATVRSRIWMVFGKVADNLGAVRNMRNGDVMKKVVIEEE